MAITNASAFGDLESPSGIVDSELGWGTVKPEPQTLDLRTLGGTPIYNDYIRVIYGNGIKGPY